MITTINVKSKIVSRYFSRQRLRSTTLHQDIKNCHRGVFKIDIIQVWKILQLSEVVWHHGVKESRKDLQGKDCASTRRNVEEDNRLHHFNSPKRGLHIRNTTSSSTLTATQENQLISLNPYLDKSGLLRVGGRLNRSDLPEEMENHFLLQK